MYHLSLPGMFRHLLIHWLFRRPHGRTLRQHCLPFQICAMVQWKDGGKAVSTIPDRVRVSVRDTTPHRVGTLWTVPPQCNILWVHVQ